MALVISPFHNRHLKSCLIFTILVLIFLYALLLYGRQNKYVMDSKQLIFKDLKYWKDLFDTSPKIESYGEGGKAVNNFSREKFPTEVGQAYRVYGFNQFLSDHISVNRSLPDFRYNSCKKTKYSDKLPTASVIIVFYDEGQSTLHRTVYSVLNRSPPELIHEIILVDDHSTLDHLKGPLEKWVSTFNGKVKLLRLETHDGLITAKNAGAAVAQGQVLIFLDSHCEASPGWLQPLLDPIVQDYRVVTAPIIDVISHETFKYTPIFNRVRGTFSWLFYYKERNEIKQKPFLVNNEKNIKSPVMAGGLFAISKRWWHEIGEYDPELYVWGGEQYEISFKIWMCGGKLLNVPCSHVGHVYRGPGLTREQQNIHIRHPNSLMTNYKRVAEVWMDDYKNFLYMNHRSVASANIGAAIEIRKQLRESLQCKDFQWYLKNIVADTVDTRYEPDLGYGSVSSVNSNDQMCICNNGLNKPLSYSRCNQCNKIWRYTWIGEFKEDEHCWDYNPQNSLISNVFCHELRGNQYFKYDKTLRQIRLASVSNKCVAASNTNHKIMIIPCVDTHQDYIKEWNVKLLDNSVPPKWANLALKPPRDQ